jgi:D-alanyl-D-alanine carboxypeptidase
MLQPKTLQRALWLGACLLAAPAWAAGDKADAVDRYVLAVMAREHIPGVAVLVMRHGKVLKRRGYGQANVEHGVKVTPATLFQSGSLGKQFTSAAVLLLQEDGKLALDDPVERYLGPGPTEWQAMTIRRLLDHTNGLAEPEEGGVFDLRRDYSDEEIVTIAHALPLHFPIGSQWKYNDLGYDLAGIIVTRVAGLFYGDFLRERVFAPLGMRTARIISDTDIVMHRAAGYVTGADGTLNNQAWVSASMNATADGSLYLSLDDWLAWNRALDRGALLSPASYAVWWGRGRLANGEPFDHGLGWDLVTIHGHAGVEFDGSWQGFRTAIGRYEDEALAIVVLCNLAEAVPERMLREIAARYAPELAE